MLRTRELLFSLVIKFSTVLLKCLLKILAIFWSVFSSKFIASLCEILSDKSDLTLFQHFLLSVTDQYCTNTTHYPF